MKTLPTLISLSLSALPSGCAEPAKAPSVPPDSAAAASNGLAFSCLAELSRRPGSVAFFP